MTNIAIKVENLSKAYQLGEIGTGTISRDLERWWAKFRGKEDPFLKIGQTNDRTSKAEQGEVVWSLKDINFEIEQGQAVGIIGRNGAGKSTLLKILSRVTSPTTGNIKLKGRVASLLEVGTGFHPELTGRENIYLNGAILGMRKSEIKRKFDEIVDFAGVEKYIDTPVKRYSSGMYVRLAFAVAAHLESEILIVDEVLAVGDAEFQKKCLGKMNDVSKGEGRTVLFVSHNMGAVKSLCSSGILLENGIIGFNGNIKDVINRYNSRNIAFSSIYDYTNNTKPTIREIKIDEYELAKNNLKVIVHFESPFVLKPVIVGIVVYDILGTPIFGTNPRIHNENYIEVSTINGISELFVPNIPLHTGTYKMSVWLGDKNTDYDFKQDAIYFEFISNKKVGSYNIETSIIGSINLISSWKTQKI